MNSNQFKFVDAHVHFYDMNHPTLYYAHWQPDQDHPILGSQVKKLADRNYLADDYILGKLISNFGYKIYLSNYIVENIVEETSFKSLILHELRWARTLKRIEPLGYALTFLTDSFILSIFAGIILFITTENSILLYLPIVITLSLRVLLHNSVNKLINSKRVTEIWLIPLRDILSFCIRIISYIGNSVIWRNNTFVVDHLGFMHRKKIVSSDDPKTTEKIPNLQTP